MTQSPEKQSLLCYQKPIFWCYSYLGLSRNCVTRENEDYFIGKIIIIATSNLIGLVLNLELRLSIDPATGIR